MSKNTFPVADKPKRQTGHPRRHARRVAARERQAERNERSAAHQLSLLDTRPGFATRERSRLATQSAIDGQVIAVFKDLPYIDLTFRLIQPE